MQQLYLQFPVKTEYLREDFFLSSANETAFNYLNQWPNWNNAIYSKILLIYGEEGCGKTHLAHIWQKLSDAKFIYRLDYNDFTQKALILEDIDNFDQESLLHLINSAQENQVYLLLTSTFSPAKLKFSLPDLNSRILSIASIAIASPDQDLLKAVLFKGLHDRGLEIHPAALDYIASRIDRSFSTLFQFIKALDQECRIQKRLVTIPLVKQVLEHIHHCNS